VNIWYLNKGDYSKVFVAHFKIIVLMKKIDFPKSTISIKIVMLALATFMLCQCGSKKESITAPLGSGVFFCDAETLSFNGDKFLS
jgi:hypothetical protein